MLLLRPVGRGQQHGFCPLSKGGRSLPLARKRRNLNNARLEEFEEFIFFLGACPPHLAGCTARSVRVSCLFSFVMPREVGRMPFSLPQSLGCWFPKKLDQGKPPLEGGAPSARRYHGDILYVPCVLPYDTVLTSVLQPALTVPLLSPRRNLPHRVPEAAARRRRGRRRRLRPPGRGRPGDRHQEHHHRPELGTEQEAVLQRVIIYNYTIIIHWKKAKENPPSPPPTLL